MNSISSLDGQNQRILKNPLQWSIGIVVLSLVLLMLFRLLPVYEISFSNWFFTQNVCGEDDSVKIRCGGFTLYAAESFSLLRAIGLRLPQLFVSATAIWLVWLVLMKPDKTSFDLLKPTHGLLSMFLGPALFTNIILKPLWGRPRPIQTLEFGGDAPYVLAGDISSHCIGNCSFVSGEATAAFWMVWIIPFLPIRWRWPVGGIIVLLASGISVLRVAFGGHFLSDVTLGGMAAFFAIALSALILQTSWISGWIDRWRDFSNQHSFGR